MDEGIHSLFNKKGEWWIVETDTIKPSITIIRGQNSAANSHTNWEVCDGEFLMTV
jgi:hypothetical protein